MIKYLVMGIKEVFKSDRCACGNKLKVFAWKNCDECDNKDKKRRAKARLEMLRKQQSRIAFKDVVFKCDKEKALDSDVLIFDDETKEIIGYRTVRG